jgi:hypothetical protein
MLTPTLQAAFVVIIAAALAVGANAIGLPLSEEVLTALAIAIVAKIFGEPSGRTLAHAIVTARTNNTRQG